jgi:hypothetical protein
MTVALRLQELLSYWSCWRDNANDPEVVYGLLSCIGYLRRSGLQGEELAQLRGIEVAVRKNFAAALGALGKFMAQSNLAQEAKQLLDSPDDEDILLSFYQDRDDAQLAWQVAQEYTDDECPPNYAVIGQIRRLLENIDDLVLFQPSVVENLRRIGTLEPVAYADPDFFWWLPAERGSCYLPSHRRDEYMARYADGTFPASLRRQYDEHLQKCHDCRTRLTASATVTEATPQAPVSLWDLLSRCLQPQFAFGDKELTPQIHQLTWQDEKQVWKAELTIAEPCQDEKFWLTLTASVPVAWHELTLYVGSTPLLVTEQGDVCCSRQMLQQMVAAQVPLRLQTQDKQEITLQYLGGHV